LPLRRVSTHAVLAQRVAAFCPRTVGWVGRGAADGHARPGAEDLAALVWPPLDDPRGERHGTKPAEAGFGSLRPQPPAKMPRARGIRLRQEDSEFAPAPTADRVGDPRGANEERREVLEEAVDLCVAGPDPRLRHVAEVEEDQRERTLGPVGPGDLTLELSLVAASIAQARELVARRRLLGAGEPTRLRDLRRQTLRKPPERVRRSSLGGNPLEKVLEVRRKGVIAGAVGAELVGAVGCLPQRVRDGRELRVEATQGRLESPSVCTPSDEQSNDERERYRRAEGRGGQHLEWRRSRTPF
jgi:hypothetical protein